MENKIQEGDRILLKTKNSLRGFDEFRDDDVYIFEGIDLSKVSAGKYFLVGLPLNLTGLDGSPVRVVLIEGIEW